VKILIAEDVRIAARLLESQLTKWGYEVIVARDGAEAWSILERPDAPRLAILDWMMPIIDGPEVCRRIRAQAQEPYIYTLLLTGKQRTEDVVEGLDAGADDYLTKPFDAQELRVRLRTGIRIVELQRELVRAREDLRFQATHDPLTGAKNRAALDAALAAEVERARRTRSELSLVMIDLDHFKRVNDTHGHPAGDSVLAEVAARLSRCLRPYDVLARYGGEEFVVLLNGCNATGAANAAERLRAAIASTPMSVAGLELAVTGSLGVASLGEGQGGAELVAEADAALYRAKARGRNRVELATASPLASCA
jgi:two-component system, cell cycle response regulator